MQYNSVMMLVCTLLVTTIYRSLSSPFKSITDSGIPDEPLTYDQAKQIIANLRSLVDAQQRELEQFDEWRLQQMDRGDRLMAVNKRVAMFGSILRPKDTSKGEGARPGWNLFRCG